jgi:hypothetical protein
MEQQLQEVHLQGVALRDAHRLQSTETLDQLAAFPGMPYAMIGRALYPTSRLS